VHELSIAVALVEMACEKAADLGDVRVDALHLRLGPLSGVVREALVFSFDVAAEGTAPTPKVVRGRELLEVCPDVHVLRDPTRGGVAATLLERPYGELRPRIC
jgi:hydrogenase nickel incorporation protein HypA/HybF